MHMTRILTRGVSASAIRLGSRSTGRTYSSTKDIKDQQHSGSRKAPEPTKQTGTATQAPNDAPASSLKSEQNWSASAQQSLPAEETGSNEYMADTKDDQHGKIKSNTPFRPAPVEKKVGAKTIAPDLEANARSANEK